MLNPLRNMVLVSEVVDKEEVLPGGIIHPASAKKALKKGVVEAVGPGEYESGVLVPVNLRVGDTAIFHANQGIEIVDTDGQSVRLLVPEPAILCKIDKPA